MEVIRNNLTAMPYKEWASKLATSFELASINVSDPFLKNWYLEQAIELWNSLLRRNMPKTTTVICDECQRDITWTNNSVDYRIALFSEGVPSKGGVVTDVMAYPPIAPGRYFCRIKCLKDWVEKHL